MNMLPGEGFNCAIYSENATKVKLCLYDATDPTKETVKFNLEEVRATPGTFIG